MQNKKISKKQLSEFGFLISFVVPILIGWILPYFTGHGFRLWTIWVGITFLILNLINPFLLLYPYKFWMWIGHALGWINSKLILGLLFLIMIIPLGLIMKIFGYDPLKLRKSNTKSYRENKLNSRINLNKIF